MYDDESSEVRFTVFDGHKSKLGEPKSVQVFIGWLKLAQVNTSYWITEVFTLRGRIYAVTWPMVGRKSYHQWAPFYSSGLAPIEQLVSHAQFRR